MITKKRKDFKIFSEVMESFVEFLVCELTHVHPNRNIIDYRISKSEDIYLKMIPFFKNYQIEGVKCLDHEDFSKIIQMMSSKAHLTEKGLQEIKLIKSKMNRARYQ